LEAEPIGAKQIFDKDAGTEALPGCYDLPESDAIPAGQFENCRPDKIISE
jgi:hypothetical protein